MPTKNTLTTERRERAIARDKNLEPTHGLAAQLRNLPFTDPLRVAYLNAIRPGTKAGSAPRTMKQLQQLVNGPK